MKRDRPSVLFVMTTMGRAGAERALLNLLETFPEGEFDLFLFALFPHGELFQELPRPRHGAEPEGERCFAALVARAVFCSARSFCAPPAAAAHCAVPWAFTHRCAGAHTLCRAARRWRGDAPSPGGRRPASRPCL